MKGTFGLVLSVVAELVSLFYHFWAKKLTVFVLTLSCWGRLVRLWLLHMCSKAIEVSAIDEVFISAPFLPVCLPTSLSVWPRITEA